MAINVPTTTWQDVRGNTEYDNTGVQYIVDTTGVFLVDTTGINIVDTGVTATSIPATLWVEDNSI